jgi:hypothetical protein
MTMASYVEAAKYTVHDMYVCPPSHLWVYLRLRCSLACVFLCYLLERI